MSRTFHHGERRIRARGIRQDPPDLRRLARALIALAEAQTEADAQASATGSAGRSVAAEKLSKPRRRDGSVDGRKESA